MWEDFHSQSRHVIDATVRLRGVPAADSLARSGDTIDLSNLGRILPREAGGGLPGAQRDTRQCRDAVHIIVDAIGLDV